MEEDIGQQHSTNGWSPSAYFPVRCGCNKVIGNKAEVIHEVYSKQPLTGLHQTRSFDKVWSDKRVNIKSDCCKSAVMTYSAKDELLAAYQVGNAIKPADFNFDTFIKISSIKDSREVTSKHSTSKSSSIDQ